MRLLEHEAKSYLRKRGLPVPEGDLAVSPAQAGAVAASLGCPVAVKALVPAGRRGKAGGVCLCPDPEAAQEAAAKILGSEIGGNRVEAVYVEAAVAIKRELYLAFTFGAFAPQMIVSLEGGVDVEQVAAERPGSFVRKDIDPAKGLRAWEAAEAWQRAGASSEELPGLAEISVVLYAAFADADALMLEINPLAVSSDGGISIVGTMLEIDDSALFRHTSWSSICDERANAEAGPNERERAVQVASRTLPGGAIRYTELDGDIGLMVAGGGAGLLQHDMLVGLGGSASCHTDVSATPSPDKPAALIEAILRNPNVRGLLIGFNYLQLASCACIAQALLIALERCKVDPRSFPIVLRLFGPAEDEARRLLEGCPGIEYLPPGSTLEDGVRHIVAAVGQKKMSHTAVEGQ